MKTKIAYLAAFIVCVTAGYMIMSWIRPHASSDAPASPPYVQHDPSPHVPIASTAPIDTSDDSAQPAQSTPTPRSSSPVHSHHSQTFTDNGNEYPLRTYEPLAINDPQGNQWWVGATGAMAAWDVGAGSTSTTVAVIDTGFALQHQEFTNRWATNVNESGATHVESSSRLNCTDRSLTVDASCNLVDDDYDGTVDNESGAADRENPSQHNCSDQNISLDKSCNLIDDDANGYIDDTMGWDFANNDSSVQAGQTNPNGSGTWHGTAVAGILGATGNNGVGIAGVNWWTRILPLQAIDDDRYGNTLTVARAVYYAANQGVDVISISLGADQADPYLRTAIRYAINSGAIVVAASGNDGCNCMSYPANYPEVVAVGAATSTNTPASFSSYGQNIDLIAPGQDMVTSSWTTGNPTATYASGVAGTSFATPYVSGLLALARSHQPDATWGELQASMQMTSNHTGLSTTTPFSITRGSGIARAHTFVNRVTTPGEPGIRYQFTTTAASSVLGSSRVYDCVQESHFPAVPLYSLSSNGSVRYTTDTLTMIDAINSGTTITVAARVCTGLPGDTPATTRSVDLRREINGAPTKP